MANAATYKPNGIAGRWMPILVLGLIVGATTSWLAGDDTRQWVATADVQIKDAAVLPDTAAIALISPTTWQNVADSENVDRDEFLRSVDATPIGASAVIQVSYRSTDESQASRIVDSIVDSYIVRSAPLSIDKEVSAINKHLSTLQTRRAELEDGLKHEQDLVVANRKQARLHSVNSWITQAQLRSDEHQTAFVSRTRDIPVVLSSASVTQHPDSPNRGLNTFWGGVVGLLGALLVGYLIYPPEAVGVLSIESEGVIVEVVESYPPVGSSVELMAKRVFDIVLGSLGLIVLSPLFVILAVGVKATSSGPVLFRQERIGYRGQPFLINKFRTMKVVNDDSEHRKFVTSMLTDDAETVKPKEGGIFKLDDPRVTKIGGFLRRYSLDELPQLWNVVKGEMSLIGPRPSLPWEHELYAHDLKQRVRSKPGCSGLWQVSGHNKLTVPEMLELDIEYVERWNVALDVEVLLRTPQAVFGRGHTR